MQGLDVVELGNGELIVNVTELTELSTVTDQLSRDWTWESLQVEWDDEGKTEWLVLIGAKRVIACQPEAA